MKRLCVAGPTELTLYVTSACDARCAFCKHTIGGIEAATTMRPDYVRRVLAQFPTVLGVCIAGFGEPLLVPWLGEIIAACREAGAYVGLITNGSRLLERADEIASWDFGRPGYLSVSLNATNEADHQACFGFNVPTWDATLEGIRHLLAQGVNVGASFVVSKSNLSQIPAMCGLAEDLGLRFCHLHSVLPHASPTEPWFLANVLREGDPDVEAALRNAAVVRGAKRVTFPALLPARGEPSPARCMSPFVSMGVDASGAVTGCRRVASPCAAHGNIADADVWNGPHFAGLRAELSAGTPNATCRACFGSVRG